MTYAVGAGFLGIPYTAELLSRGDHPVSATISSVNPAGLRFSPFPSIHASYGNWLADSKHMTVLYSRQRFGGELVVKGRYVGIDDLEYRNETPTDDPQALFSSYSAAIEWQYARKISSKLTVGVGGKFTSMSLYTASTRGLAFDAGVVYSLSNDTELGLAILNLGTMSGWGQTEPSYPVRVTAGGSAVFRSMPLSPRLLISMESNSHVDGLIMNAGSELHWNQLVFRLGSKASTSVFSTSGGVGIQMGIYTVNYGFQVGSQNLGMPHVIDVSIRLPS